MSAFALAICVLSVQTSIPASGTEPDWSPDGNQIAFGVSEKPGRSLWIMNADGSNPRKVVPASDRPQHYPRWFPDGSRLAFVTRQGPNCEYITVKPDGSDPKPLLPERAPKPDLVPVVWTPDGKRVAYSSRPKPGEPPKVAIVDVQSGEVVTWVPGEVSSSPRFSPDGTRLVYKAGESMIVADANGQNGKIILKSGPNWFPIDPSWSPDSNFILYATIVDDERSELWKARPDGSASLKIFSCPTRFFYPAWSSRGDRIAFAMRKTETWDLWLHTVDPEGKNLKVLAGFDSGAPIFDLMGNYQVEGSFWPKPGSEPSKHMGESTWIRALGGRVVRERWTLDTEERQYSGELSLTRVAPNTYEAVQLNEWTGEQFFMAGVWDSNAKTLTFNRVLTDPFGAAPRPEFVRWVYRFGSGGSYTKQLFVGDPKGELTRQAEYRYTKDHGKFAR